MNKDQVKGTIDELAGRARQKAGELTGNKRLQVKGIVQQGKGKLENALGSAKTALRSNKKDAKAQPKPRT